jgi:deoxyribonuclease V
MADLAKLKEEQIRLSKKLKISDNFLGNVKTVAGCDIVYTPEKIISVISVCDAKTLKLKEQKYSVSEIKFPYIPGFLSYREAMPLIETYHKLETKPDILLIEGNGILHPRKFGVASHVGILLDKPTIGVTKKLLCGKVIGDTVYIQKEAVGKIFGTKDKAKPIYVSPGHCISLKGAVEKVKETLAMHKLPEPMHIAHKYAAKLKRRFKEEKNSEKI